MQQIAIEPLIFQIPSGWGSVSQAALRIGLVILLGILVTWLLRVGIRRKDWSALVIDLAVAYKEDTDRVASIMKDTVEDMRQHETFGPKILEPMEILGVDNFADSGVVVRGRIKTKPIEQWNVGREFRRRIKKAFEAQGIEIPFPHRSLYVGAASAPFRVELCQGSQAARS